MATGIRTGDPRGFNNVRSSVKVPEFGKHKEMAEGQIGRNVVKITIKMETIVRKPFMINTRSDLMNNVSGHQLPQYYRLQRVPFTA